MNQISRSASLRRQTDLGELFCDSGEPVEIIDLRTTHDEGLLEQVYRELYLTCFTDPDEQEDLEQYRERLYGPQKPIPQPVTHFLVAGDNLSQPESRVLAGFMIFELYRESSCGLLTYIVVAPPMRGRGLGRKLLRQAIDILAEDCAGGLRAIFAETHDPSRVDPAKDAMSPDVRIEVMRRLDAQHIPVRYVQPALRENDQSSDKLFLISFPIELGESHTVPAQTVLTFLDEFYRALGVQDPHANAHYLRIQSDVAAALRIDLTRGTTTADRIPLVPLPSNVELKESGVKFRCARYVIDDTSFGLITDWKLTTGPFSKDPLRATMRALHELAKLLTSPTQELNGLFAILEMRRVGEESVPFLITANNEAVRLSYSIEDLELLGVEVVPLQPPPTSVESAARFLVSFSSAAPRAGRVEINDAFHQFIIAIQTRMGSVISTEPIATLQNAWKTLPQWITAKPNLTVLGVPHCGLAWKLDTPGDATNPFESFEYDLAARIFCGPAELKTPDQAKPAADEDLECPELRFSDCAIALHFVTDFLGTADSSRKHAFHSEPLVPSNDRFLLEFAIPDMFYYEAEGTDKALASDRGAERRLRFYAHLSRTIVAGLREVVHLVLNPVVRHDKDDDGSLTAYDIIKISKLWAGGERSRFKNSLASQLGLQADISHSDWSHYQFRSFTHISEVIEAYLVKRRRGDKQRFELVGGTIQILIGDDEAGQEVFQEIVAIASDDQLPTPAEERPPRISRGLLEMAGIKTSILDFEYVDALEIDETFRDPIMPNEDSFFLGLHKGTLVHFSLKDRAYLEAKNSIGISPYLLFPHAVLLHNEQCLLEAKQAADGTYGEQEISTLRAAELKIREKVQQHMQPNVFEYATEQSIYSFGHKARGLDKLREALDDQLKGINGRLEEEADKKKYGSEVFFVLAGLLIGMGQFVAGWEALNNLFFGQAAEAASAADMFSRKYFFQVVALTLLLTLLWFGVSTWRNLRALHGQRDAVTARATYLLAVLISAFILAFLMAILINIVIAICKAMNLGMLDEWIVSVLILVCLTGCLYVERKIIDEQTRKGWLSTNVERLARKLGALNRLFAKADRRKKL